ncbi:MULTISPECIES: helix-turn-helix transcriptional regulator [unclassified Desulfovibrio]|uniref:phage regulatory CII family protein n=1 Tax=unclassified Desulfovibrio TaxID=2593640 RepID=UPI0013EC2B0F|nr:MULTISPECIES: helix-turn-helix transcriptional regulator [unclassified Desulfovibrio]
MPDYQNMSAIGAVRHAKAVSGMTVEQIAKAADMPASTIRHYLERNSGYAPTLERIPILCRAMGNEVIVQWIEAQLDVPEAPPARSRAEVLTAMARAAACMGDAQRVLADSEGRGIDPACARDVRSLLGDVIAECRQAQASLAEQASYRDMTEVAPLASVRRNAPWWGRFWRW